MNPPTSTLFLPDLLEVSSEVTLPPERCGWSRIVLPVEPAGSSGGDSAIPVIKLLLSPKLAARLVSFRSHVRNKLGPLQALDIDDAMRRVSPCNAFHLEWEEAWIEALCSKLAMRDNPIDLVISNCDTIDAPSLHVIVHAAIRVSGSGRRTRLSLMQSKPGCALPSHVRNALTCLGVENLAFTESDTVSAILSNCPRQEFLERNYPAAAAGLAGADEFDKQALHALIRTRTRSSDENLTGIWSGITDNPCFSVSDRASACSTESVLWAKQGKLEEALRCIRKGQYLLERRPGIDSAHIRGWLSNNQALVSLLKAFERRSKSRSLCLEEPFQYLAGAFKEAEKVPFSEFPNLHNNMAANAVQLFELKRDYKEALRLLDERFGSSGGVVYLYRRAGLLIKAGALEAAECCYASALRECPEWAWFWIEIILHASGCGFLRRGMKQMAGRRFERGWKLCRRSGLAAGLLRHGSGIATVAATTGKRCHLSYEGAIAPFLIPRNLQPLPKLPPFIPALDLSNVTGRSVNATLTSS